MTKELAAISLLTVIAAASWFGWLFFEGASVLTQVDYSEKTAETLNPVLHTEIIQNITE